MTEAKRLFMAANNAAADAIRWARDPNGKLMAELRRRDAATLRALARAALKS
jgi:hypothetical protein